MIAPSAQIPLEQSQATRGLGRAAAFRGRGTGAGAGDVILDIGPPYECTAFSPGRAPSDGIQGNLASGFKMIVRRDVQRGK